MNEIFADKEKVLASDLSAVQKMAKRLKLSLDKIKKINLTKEYLESANDDQIAMVDSFILRFSRLQDTLGQKLFRRILELSGEEAILMIDRLNKMEKLGIIKDAHGWMAIREIRNNITHDYDGGAELQYAVENLRLVVVYSPILLEVASKAEKYAKEKFGV